jgi:hypothetical protein
MTIDPFKKLNKGIKFQRKKMDFPGISGEIPRLIFTMNFASNPAKAKKKSKYINLFGKKWFLDGHTGKRKKGRTVGKFHETGY